MKSAGSISRMVNITPFSPLFQRPLSPPGHSGPLFTFCSPGSGLQEASKASLILKETTPGGPEKDQRGEVGTVEGTSSPPVLRSPGLPRWSWDLLENLPQARAGPEHIYGESQGSAEVQRLASGCCHCPLPQDTAPSPRKVYLVSPQLVPTQASAPATQGCLTFTGHHPRSD